MRIRLNNSGVGSKDIDPAGGTITAPLRLTGTPTNPLEAVASAYVLNAASSFSGATVTGVFAAARLPAYTGTELSSAGNGIFTLNATGVAAGTYAKVTVDTKGRVTGNGVLLSTDIPNLSYTKLIDKPTTLAGYGIVDVVSLSGSTMTGPLLLNGTPTLSTHLVSKSYVDTRVGGSGASAFVTGDVVSKSSATTPSGFLRCNGGAVNRITYAGLFSIINTTYNKAGSLNSAGKPWCMQYDFNKIQTSSITGWTTTTPLPVQLQAAQAIITSNRVYLIGGTANNSTVSSVVYTTSINSDGTLGTWTTSASLPTGVNSSQVVVTSNRVYLIGGSDTSIVYTATINSDGTLGSWSTSNPLPFTSRFSQAVVTPSRVYLLGGYVNNAPSSAVYSAPVNTDGTLGTWTIGTALPTTIYQAQAIVTSSRVYLIGGITASYGNAASPYVYTAPINTDGTLGAWTTSSDLPGPLYRTQAVVTSNRVFLLGGQISNAGNDTAIVYTAPINENGTLGTWATSVTLPLTIYETQVIVSSSRVFLLGGYSSSSGALSTAYSASFLGGFNDYTNYSTQITTAATDFMLPDTTLDDTVGFFSYIKF